MTKRTIAVTIKLSKADLERFEKCQQDNWPHIQISRSTLLLTLAKLGAERLELEKHKKPNK